MACGACQKRRQRQGKIVPVIPRKSDESKAQQQGDKLRDKLRYTGR